MLIIIGGLLFSEKKNLKFSLLYLRAPEIVTKYVEQLYKIEIKTITVFGEYNYQNVDI